jgi:hypothetical protein
MHYYLLSPFDQVLVFFVGRKPFPSRHAKVVFPEGSSIIDPAHSPPQRRGSNGAGLGASTRSLADCGHIAHRISLRTQGISLFGKNCLINQLQRVSAAH